MTKVNDFKLAMKRLYDKIQIDEYGDKYIRVSTEQDENDAQIMSNSDNWCCVHATRYRPLKDKDGNMVITSLAMVTNGMMPRQTVNFALNHVVESHDSGNWDDCSYVVLCPYNKVVENNGNPAGLDLVDTFFSTDIDKGLTLPSKDVYFIEPMNEQETGLYTIGENYATYKNGNFSADQIHTILSFMTSKQLNDFNRFMSGDLTKQEIDDNLRNDRVKHAYEISTDKKAFLRGIMQDKRDEMLAAFLRDNVVRIVMEKMGFKYVDDALNRAGGRNGVAKSLVGRAVEDVAVSKKIPTFSNVHNYSLYGKEGIQDAFVNFANDAKYIMQEKNMDNLFAKLYNCYNSFDPKFFWVYRVIVENKFPDNYYADVYESEFKKYKNLRMEEYKRNTPEHNEKYGYMYLDIQNVKNIEEFDSKYAKALTKQVQIFTEKLRVWRKQMEKNSSFEKLLQKWHSFITHNYEDLNEFLKQSIEDITYSLEHNTMNQHEHY